MAIVTRLKWPRVSYITIMSAYLGSKFSRKNRQHKRRRRHRRHSVHEHKHILHSNNRKIWLHIVSMMVDGGGWRKARSARQICNNNNNFCVSVQCS